MSRTIIMLSCFSSKIPSPITDLASLPYPCVRNFSDAATRAGVRSSPSRDGSSPISSSWRRMISSNSLSPFVLDIIVFGFPEHQPLQLPGRDLRLENLPERSDDVLRSRDDVLHERHVEIEVPVVHHARDLLLDDLLQLGQIEDISGLGVGLAFDRNVQRVVVAVPVLVVALPEESRVLLVAEGRVMNPMGGVEPHSTGYCHCRHCFGKISDAKKLRRRRSFF